MLTKISFVRRIERHYAKPYNDFYNIHLNFLSKNSMKIENMRNKDYSIKAVGLKVVTVYETRIEGSNISESSDFTS